MALKKAPIIETRCGTHRKPPELMFLRWAHDRYGKPIFGSDDGYVSPKYPLSVHYNLMSLGITLPSWKWVCTQLLTLKSAGTLHGVHRTDEWYSDLSKVILEAYPSLLDEGSLDEISDIPLIPIEDGTWRTIPSDSNPIYFPVSLGTNIPSGLSLNLVKKEACSCPHRIRLFRLLGVKDCEVNNIIERIIEHHKVLKTARKKDVVAHVRYLYQAQLGGGMDTEA